MAKNVPKTTANTENNVYNQHKTTTCIPHKRHVESGSLKKMKIPNPKSCSMYSRLRNFTTSLSKTKTRYSLLLHQVILTNY